MLRRNFHRIHALERANADAQCRAAQVVKAAGRVLSCQTFLDQALQVAVGRGAPVPVRLATSPSASSLSALARTMRKRAAIETDWMVPERFSPAVV
jgi:hypothetical protein